MRLALFINPVGAYSDHHRKDGFVEFSGQFRRKTFDKAIESGRSSLFMFVKNPKTGWHFHGIARFVSVKVPRTDTQPPVWILRVNKRDPHEGYKSKKDLLNALGLHPLYKNLALGIVPLSGLSC
jgi:hypothetical protein